MSATVPHYKLGFELNSNNVHEAEGPALLHAMVSVLFSLNFVVYSYCEMCHCCSPNFGDSQWHPSSKKQLGLQLGLRKVYVTSFY
jgi:hypothetical protein